MDNIILYFNNLLNKNNHKEKDIYEKNISTVKLNEIDDIRKKYKIIDVKIIDVKWIDKLQVNYSMFGDDYFNVSKKHIINSMLEHYLTDKDKEINYICNKKEKICICNINANNFRKIYDDINYKDEIYISWIKKCNEPF